MIIILLFILYVYLICKIKLCLPKLFFSMEKNTVPITPKNYPDLKGLPCALDLGCSEAVCSYPALRYYINTLQN